MGKAYRARRTGSYRIVPRSPWQASSPSSPWCSSSFSRRRHARHHGTPRPAVASTYAGRHRLRIWELIFWLVGFWFILCRRRVLLPALEVPREGRPERRSTSPASSKSEKKLDHDPAPRSCWSATSSSSYGAVKVWYDVKQYLPPAQQTVRVIGQQWAWTFVHAGPDGQLDTAKTTSPRSTSCASKGHALPLQARVPRRAAQLLGAGLPTQAGRDPRPRDHRLVRADQDR